MSVRALLLATVAQMRKPVADGGLGLDENTCDTTPPSGKPPPVAGDWFYGVHRGNVVLEKDESDYRVYAIKVTISARMQSVPWDRLGPELQERMADGMDDRVDAMIAMMTNQKYVVMNAANALIEGTQDWVNVNGGTATHNGFIEPLFLLGEDDEPDLRSGAWWEAQPDEPKAGISLTVRFGKARRVQVLGSVS
jgi:hypothetical protein